MYTWLPGSCGVHLCFWVVVSKAPNSALTINDRDFTIEQGLLITTPDMTTRRALSHKDYTVACICPMNVELASVEVMLDEIHDSLPPDRDHNAYTMGKIGGHNVVVAVMPEIGNSAAATVATQLLNDFPSIRFGLLVSIGGGVPGDRNEDDIRLSDVVVSQPTDIFGGVVQYDLGKRLVNKRFERTG
jgi:hypothetical protein